MTFSQSEKQRLALMLWQWRNNISIRSTSTSLSKAYKVINRFSEDIDLTYDICKLIQKSNHSCAW